MAILWHMQRRTEPARDSAEDRAMIIDDLIRLMDMTTSFWPRIIEAGLYAEGMSKTDSPISQGLQPGAGQASLAYSSELMHTEEELAVGYMDLAIKQLGGLPVSVVSSTGRTPARIIDCLSLNADGTWQVGIHTEKGAPISTSIAHEDLRAKIQSLNVTPTAANE